jgi:hypothetical protein
VSMHKSVITSESNNLFSQSKKADNSFMFMNISKLKYCTDYNAINFRFNTGASIIAWVCTISHTIPLYVNIITES